VNVSLMRNLKQAIRLPGLAVWRGSVFLIDTTAAPEWGGRIVIPGGESRPGIRSSEVSSARAR
jgi:hypothetical protein